MKTSTVLWLQGGLGNQLFQWNAGLHLAKRAGSPLIVSTASFRRDKLRDFSLRSLATSLSFTSSWENLAIGPPHHRGGPVRERAGVYKLPVRQGIEGPSTPGQVLVGFFQDAASLSLETLAVRTVLMKRREQLESTEIARFVKDRPVAHIRRGDYASVQAALNTFGSIRHQYYGEALDLLGHDINDAAFFTDDPDYVKETFGVPERNIFGPSRTESDLESLLVMSLGQALVIPNSTFSWWAAELMGQEGRVVSPEVWFRDSRSGHNLGRQHWLRVSN